MGKKPDISKFREVLHKTGGNLSKVAAVFNVTRKTVYDWARADSQFKDAITDERGSLVDECLVSIIRKSKFPQNPKRSVRFSGKRTKRSVQKRKARNTQKAETKVL